MIFFKNKSLEDEKFPGGRGIYIKKISIYLSIYLDSATVSNMGNIFLHSDYS